MNNLLRRFKNWLNQSYSETGRYGSEEYFDTNRDFVKSQMLTIQDYFNEAMDLSKADFFALCDFAPEGVNDIDWAEQKILDIIEA